MRAMQRRYAIIGTGALGGFYGARLQRAGCEVHFLVHSDYEHVREHGLRCDSKDGDFRLPHVHAYQHARDLPPCDVVLVALKTTHNHLLPALLPPTGLVLTLQNGLGNEETIAAITGAERVVGGVAFLCSHKVGPGHIRHLDYGQITLGEFSAPGITDRLRAIAADFERAGIPVRLEPDLRVVRWRKLVWNIPFNGLSVILDAPTDALVRQAETRALILDVMREVVRGANACDVALTETDITQMMEYSDRMTPYQPSMKLDFDAGRPLELDAIFAEPLRRAQAAGVALPRIETLHRQLTFLDHRNRSR